MQLLDQHLIKKYGNLHEAFASAGALEVVSPAGELEVVSLAGEPEVVSPHVGRGVTATAP